MKGIQTRRFFARPKLSVGQIRRFRVRERARQRRSRSGMEWGLLEESAGGGCVEVGTRRPRGSTGGLLRRPAHHEGSCNIVIASGALMVSSAAQAARPSTMGAVEGIGGGERRRQACNAVRDHSDGRRAKCSSPQGGGDAGGDGEAVEIRWGSGSACSISDGVPGEGEPHLSFGVARFVGVAPPPSRGRKDFGLIALPCLLAGAAPCRLRASRRAGSAGAGRVRSGRVPRPSCWGRRTGVLRVCG